MADIGITDPFSMGQFLMSLAGQDRLAMQMAESMGITPQSLRGPDFGTGIDTLDFEGFHDQMPSEPLSLGQIEDSPYRPPTETALEPTAPEDPTNPLTTPRPPTGPIHQARVVPQQQQRWPQVRMPEQQRPIFSGGVHGAQKAPDFGVRAGMTPAQALMQALLGNQQPRQQQAGGRRQQQSLGEVLGG